MQTLFGTLLQPLSPTQCRITRPCTVRVGDDGRIAQVASDGTSARDRIGDEQCWILPGFVDAHLHIPQWDCRGIDGIPLFQWQEKVGFPAEQKLSDPKAAETLAEDFVSGMIASGTTTVCAFGTPFAQEVEATFAVLAKRGLRAIYGMTLNDIEMPSALAQHADEALDESRKLAAKWHGAENGRLRYAFSPRASIRCSEKLMRGAAALAEMLKCHVQTHVAESLEELSEVRQRFPDQVDEVDLFREVGLLNARTILAHGVLLNHNERRELTAGGASLVHCPTSNLFRECGLMDCAAHRAIGTRIALGSGIAGGFDPFMPRVAVEGIQTSKAIRVHSLPRRSAQVLTPTEAWWMLTAGGAGAIGLGDTIGRIEAGFQADCLVVRPETWILNLPQDQQISALLYTIKPEQIEHVFIAGKRVGRG
jgi:guanine deaminase